MPLLIIRNDITKVKCDAVVNAANPTLLGGGGVDGAIHHAAGKRLLEECRTLGGCKTGQAKITMGYELPAKYVIHTVGPVWRGGNHGEEETLRSCYKNSLRLALENGCESVAFPLISSGIYGYPKEEALNIAVEEISRFLMKNDMLVYIVVFGRESFAVSKKLFGEVEEYINDRYASQNEIRRSFAKEPFCYQTPECCTPVQAPMYSESAIEFSPCESVSIEDLINQIDESFTQMLLRKIDEKGMTDPECYKKANIDRKLFSKIRKDIDYKPSKPTVIAFAIALELSLEETTEMLMKAGFALSHSSKFDIIIEYFISRGIYNIFTINDMLFAFDQPLLGA